MKSKIIHLLDYYLKLKKNILINSCKNFDENILAVNSIRIDEIDKFIEKLNKIVGDRVGAEIEAEQN